MGEPWLCFSFQVSWKVVWNRKASSILWERQVYWGKLHAQTWQDRPSSQHSDIVSHLLTKSNFKSICCHLCLLVCVYIYLYNSKGKIRKAEGTAIIQDMKEPAKLGVSFSYCKFIYLIVCDSFFKHQKLTVSFFDIQLHLTPPTGSCPLTTTAYLLFIHALMFWGCFMWITPGYCHDHAFCLQRPSITPKKSSHVTTSMWAKWLLQISKDVILPFKQRRLI